MQVCILSMQNVQNFGSLLQSYSLKKIIEGLGHDVSFIPIEPNEDDNSLMIGAAEDYLIESGSRDFWSRVRRVDKYFINRLHIKKLQAVQNVKFNDFRTEWLKIKAYDKEKQYDLCVIGSDEVFNCNIKSTWGFTSQLFGNVHQADKVITYAASCGSTLVDNVSKLVRERIEEAFERISVFSVRDENTKKFVYKISGREPIVHLDPVVIGNFDEEIGKCQIPDYMPEYYCVVYSYYNRFNNEQDIVKIKRFCKERNLDIISLGAPQMWIKKHVVCDPFQMLKVFQYADFVITDTFHGTIFAVKYTKRFAIILRESNRCKLMDLINRLHIRSHLIENMKQLKEVYLVENNFDYIHRIEQEEYRRTLDYLDDFIK